MQLPLPKHLDENAALERVDPDKDARMRLLAAHYTIMENANELARLAIRTCGGQSMLKSLPLERLYRDSRCGSLMLPWNMGKPAPVAIPLPWRCGAKQGSERRPMQPVLSTACGWRATRSIAVKWK